MHKRNFTLDTGDCLNDDNYSILSFEVKVEDEDVVVLLPETEALDAVIGTQRWMTRRNAAKPIGNGDVEIVGPRDAVTPPSDAGCAMGGCNDSRLEW